MTSDCIMKKMQYYVSNLKKILSITEPYLVMNHHSMLVLTVFGLGHQIIKHVHISIELMIIVLTKKNMGNKELDCKVPLSHV